MSRFRWPYLAAVACIAFMGVSTTAVRAADVKSASDTTHSKFGQLYRKKDTASLLKMMKGVTTPDFKVNSAEMKMTLEAWLDQQRAVLANTRTVRQFELKTTGSKSAGNQGTVTSTLQYRSTVVDPNHKPHEMNLTGHYREAWIQRAGQWKLKELGVLSEKWTMDGKPYIPPPPLPH